MTPHTEPLYRCRECCAVTRASLWDLDADYRNESWQGSSICPVCRHDNGGDPEEVGEVASIPRRDSS